MKRTITAPSAGAMLGGGELLGRGEGDTIVVGLGHNGGCKGKLEGGGVFREEECGGQKE